jgi:hypothetical protein
MAYSVVPTVANGDSWSAAQHNTYLRDNLAAIFVGTTAGDLDYYTGPTAKSRLALVVNGLLIGAASAPAWLAGVAGGLLYGASGGAPAWLASAAKYRKLRMNAGATAPEWVNDILYLPVALNAGASLEIGDDKARFRIPAICNGMNIVSVAASRKSGTGVLTLQLRNVTDAVDVLSTKLTVDSGETDSLTAATPAVINTANDEVATGDQFAVDVDDPGTLTLFANIEIGFAHP